MARTIKPVGLCPQCKQVLRVPGRSYCAACATALWQEVRAARERRERKGATPPAEARGPSEPA